MQRLRLFGGLFAAVCSLCLAGSVLAADLATLVGNLTKGGFGDRETAINALAASGEARAAPILEALAVVERRGDRDALSVLQAAANNATDAEVKAAAVAAAGTVRQTLAAWE